MKRVPKCRQAGNLLLAVALGLSAWSGSALAQPASFNRPTSGAGWVDRSGFGELVTRSVGEGVVVGTLFGLALSDPNDPGSFSRLGMGGLIGAAGGLALPLLLSQGEVRTGDVVFMGAAQGIGLANGFLLPLAIQLVGCEQGSTTTCTLASAPWDQIRLDAALGAVLSLGAGAATQLVSRQLSFTPGQAEAMGSAALWGALVGILLSQAISPSYVSASLFLGMTLAGADAGFATAFFLRNLFDMDRARIHFLDLGVGVGIGFGAAIAYFISPTFTNLTGVSLSMLMGSAVGWVVAYYATAGLDGFKNGLPPQKASASLDVPTIRPLVSMARGERSIGLQVDLLQGRF